MADPVIWRAASVDATRTPAGAASTSLDLLAMVERLRGDVGRHLTPERRSALGQYFTPAPTARLMTSMLDMPAERVHILDAGAGVGALFAACVATLCQRPCPPAQIEVTAYELDGALGPSLSQTMDMCRALCEPAGVVFAGRVVAGDFIEHAVAMLRGDLFAPRTCPAFTCAVLNPPYRKIHSRSRERTLLRQIGIETSNLYTGFLAAAIKLLGPGGELVAITPRSFCNGPYFRPFRRLLLDVMRIERLHVFDSRDVAFSDDGVLQENIIIHARKTPRTGRTVTISASAGPDDVAVVTSERAYEQVVRPGDPEAFIHIMTDGVEERVARRMALLGATLDDLGLSVSTGRVVEFRAREWLRAVPESGSAPLVHPAHFDGGYVRWPRPKSRKPNALWITDGTRDLLVPNEHYVLIRRFSAKEEARRVVAAVYDARRVPGDWVGFENHLNYVHRGGHGLPLALARGLAAYLNSTLVDLYLRQFSGHTQVNATDLRALRYPTLSQLAVIGDHVASVFPAQSALDLLIEREVFAVIDPDGDPIRVRRRIDEGRMVLRQLGLPAAQQNDRSALTLLALAGLGPDAPWPEASAPLRGVTELMRFMAQRYGKNYAPNTRETIRRQTLHQLVEAGFVVLNPDNPDRPTNSGATVYQIERGALALLQTVGTQEWDRRLHAYLDGIQTLKQRYAQERLMARVPVTVREGTVVTLSPGGQNVLVQRIVADFGARFMSGGMVVYVGDTAEKFLYLDRETLERLGVLIEAHGKMPDVVIYAPDRHWLALIEAVTSHGPITPQRREELRRLFDSAAARSVYITAFLDRRALARYVTDLAWETEVWVAESPDHLIHFDGERLIVPEGS